MNPMKLTVPEPDQLHDELSDVLREVHGPDASLEDCVARPLSKHGRHRAVRYDLVARVAGAPQAFRDQWVGKFYGRDDEARRVATILRAWAATGCRAPDGLVIPAVLAYHAPFRLLLLRYEPGESMTAALARNHALALPAIGRALAALHATPVAVDERTTAAAVLDDLRPRMVDLCARFPGRKDFLRQSLEKLERRTPDGPARPSFLHGDLGPAQLLWQMGRVVVLDFDKCTGGDPALDLGNLATQLRRLTLRKPGKLPDFGSLRHGLLDAYERWSRPDPGLGGRVAWYERVMLVRKAHFLASDTTRRTEADALGQRQAEAAGLLGELPALLESG